MNPSQHLQSPPINSGTVDGRSREGTPPPSATLSSTPIKKDRATERLFSTYTQYRHPTVHNIGHNMKSSVVGPMPIKDFLDDFLPLSRIPDYSSTTHQFRKHCSFNAVVGIANELGMYEPFVSSAILVIMSPNLPLLICDTKDQ